MYWTIVGVSIAIVFAIYRLYKRLLGPAYIPGCVKHVALNSSSKFDDASLIARSTATEWFMPDNIKLFHTCVSSLSSTISSSSSSPLAKDVLCVSGGPGVAVSKPWGVCEVDRLLKEGFKFHHFHPRGCGHSTKPIDKFPSKALFSGLSIIEQTLGLGAQVSDIERMRRRIVVTNDHTKKISIIGHSFGGFIGTLYAAEFPEMVQNLVLLAPANVLKVPPAEEGDFFAVIRSKLQNEEDRKSFDDLKKRYFEFHKLVTMKEADVVDLQKEVADFFHKVDPVGKQIAEQRQDLKVGGWTSVGSYLSFGMQADFRKSLSKRLEKAPFRTIIVSGDEDIFDHRLAEEYVKLFPPSKVEHVVLQAGHFPHDEIPDELAECIASTLLFGQ